MIFAGGAAGRRSGARLPACVRIVRSRQKGPLVKTIVSAGLAVLALAAGPAIAQDDLAARQAVAKEYLDLSNQTMDFDALAAQVAPSVLQPISQRQPALYSSKRVRLTEIVEESFAESMREAMLGLDTDMAKAFTLAELTALRDFYASPVGMSVMTKMPAFMAESMPRIMQASAQDLGSMLEQLRAEGVELD